MVVTKRIATAAPKDTADFSLTVSLTRTIPSDSALPVEKWGHPQKLMRQGLLDGLEEFAKTLQQIPCGHILVDEQSLNGCIAKRPSEDARHERFARSGWSD